MKGAPGLIAHRGASGYAPENTMASFRRCLEMGATAIEFDVQQTKDGRLVVIHDYDLKRVAGSPRRVAECDYEELRRLDVGSWLDPKYAGERVPLLEELLDLARGKAELQLEIKNPERPYPGIEERVVNCLRGRPEWKGQVCLSSFNHETLFLARALDKDIRLGYLVGPTSRPLSLREAQELACESVHISQRQADRDWAEAVHKAGRKLLVYTVNEPKDYERLQALGVDAVFTNFPDLRERCRRAGHPIAPARAGILKDSPDPAGPGAAGLPPRQAGHPIAPAKAGILKDSPDPAGPGAAGLPPRQEGAKP